MALRTLVLLLAGCTRSEPEDSAADTGDPPDPSGPAVLSPADAEDLDAADGAVSFQLVAAPLDDGEDFAWAYNGQVPGPTLRAQVGDQVTVEIRNELPDPTTVHWHGLRVPFQADGVQWMSDPIEPGETRTVSFEADRAGTFWYHPHFDSHRQVDQGLYGAFVVEDPADPPMEDFVVLFDAVGEEDEDDNDAHGLHDGGLDWVANAVRDGTASLPAGTLVRARFVNVSNTGYLDLFWPGLRQVASDQGLLDAAFEPPNLLLAPGDRADFEWRIGLGDFEIGAFPYSADGGSLPGDPDVRLTVHVTGDAPSPPGADWPFAGADPTPDPGYTDLVYVFQGDPHTGVWLINGETYPDVTVEELPFDSEAIIEVRNLSPALHPFHLHGMPFEVLSIDGAPVTRRAIEDTVNVGIYGRVRLRLVADNAGDWMAHCHILPHAHGGMMTVLRVLPP